MASFYESLKEIGINGDEPWYFGLINRDKSNSILLKCNKGTYLIRSKNDPKQFALSVRNESVDHYLIHAVKRQSRPGYKFHLGEQGRQGGRVSFFDTIEALIDFYKEKAIAEVHLTNPAKRPVYKALYDFAPTEEGVEVALRKHEHVDFYGNFITGRTENKEWYRVKRSSGEMGFAPANYLSELSSRDSDCAKFSALQTLQFPFEAEVMRDRNPNIFDNEQLKLLVGDTVEVHKMMPNQPEIWYGMNRRNGMLGLFPFNYVRPVEHSDPMMHRRSGDSNRISQHSAMDDLERGQ